MHMLKISKKIFILSMMVLASLVVVSCSDSSTETTEPTNTTEDPINHTFDMDTVYYSGDGYEVTYKELYQSIVLNDGIDQLIEMVDQQIFADYYDDITAEDIDTKRIKLTYGTTDQEEIDDIPEKRKTKMEESYTNGMIVLGFADNDVPYLEVLVARDLYVKDLLTNSELEDNEFYIDAMDVAEEYMKRRVGDVQSILVRFDTRQEANQMLLDNNLVEYDGALRLYTDTEIPLSQVPSYNLTDDNTRALTNEELIEYFVLFYNDIYQDQKDALSASPTLSELLDNEALTYEYQDLVEISSRLGNLLFEGLSTMSDTDPERPFYTYRPYEISINNGKDFYMVLNLDRHHVDLEDFEGDQEDLISLIGADVYEDIQEDLVDKNLTDGRFMDRRLKEYREERGFEIFDYYLKLDYESVVPEDMEVTSYNKSDHVIATLDTGDILVKDLMSFSLERKAPLYLVHASQLDLVRNAHYDDIYCDDEGECELDYTQNNSGAMNTHISEYTNLEESFLTSQYALYYSFEDYLYLAYGVRNDVEMMNRYVKRTLEPLFIYDHIMENKQAVIDDLMAILDDYYTNYFSLDVRHILIYLDLDGDGRPDDYEDFYADLEDTTEYDLLLADFEAAIRTFLDENDDDLNEFITSFRDADRDDETWGQYKRYGFRVLTENLSAQESLTYMNSYQNYEEPFVEGLIDLYQVYTLEENKDLSFMYSQNLVETSYGLHLIKAEKGDDFDLPSAEFTLPSETDFNYPEGLSNDDFRISESQIEVYMNYRIFDVVSNLVDIEEIYGFEQPDLPTRLEDLFELLLQDIHDAMYTNAFINMASIDVLEAGSLVDDSMYSYFTETEIYDYFAALETVYHYQVFAQFE